MRLLLTTSCVCVYVVLYQNCPKYNSTSIAQNNCFTNFNKYLHFHFNSFLNSNYQIYKIIFKNKRALHQMGPCLDFHMDNNNSGLLLFHYVQSLSRPDLSRYSKKSMNNAFFNTKNNYLNFLQFSTTFSLARLCSSQ